MKKFWQKIKVFLRKFFLVNDTPHKVAAGAALGIFLGIVPGEGLISTLIFASVFRFNRLAALTGVMAVNMWATLIVLPVAAIVGEVLFGESYQEMVQDFHQVYEMGFKYFLTKVAFFDLVLPLAIGFVIVAGVIALAFYFLLLILLRRKHIRHLQDKL